LIDTILYGDCRQTLKQFAAAGVRAQMCVTSPPYYGLRDYGNEDNQIGLEESPEEFIQQLVEVFRGVRDVLTDDGTLWVNIGDSYYNYRSGKGQALPKQSVASNSQDLPQIRNPRRGNKLKGLKDKDLIGIPWMLAFALRADGWYLRQDIIWSKPNPMPESMKDRCTKSHEYIFLLSKSKNYYFDVDAIKEPTVEGNALKRKRSVWEVTTKPYKGAHFAVYPSELIEPCILAGSQKGDVILDPFMGSGTTATVAKELGRHYIGCELHQDYENLIEKRLTSISGSLKQFLT
jgi:DNA modification methylase